MIPAVEIQGIAEKTELAVLKTLAYFDIFNYPLTEQEIRNFSGAFTGEEEMRSALRELSSRKMIFQFNNFYSLRADTRIAENRLRGNLRAGKLLPKAVRIGAFLYKFPYVRAVAISGSLSKNYADAKADIDFFIITKENRLWIARTFLHLFKKLTFLLGRQHFYCMNYFVDGQALRITEQNVYSATEIVTLLPAGGGGMLNRFFKINSWVQEWLPAYAPDHDLKAAEGNSWLKATCEKVLDAKWGDKLDDLLFRWTSRRWQKKATRGSRNLKGKIMTLLTDKHFSKSDPGAFQERIVSMYKARVDELAKLLAKFS